MRVLVTGGAGFIGSAVCRHLVQTCASEVLNIDKLTYAASPRSLADMETDSRYRFLQVDICDRAAMDEALASFDPDVIVHLAAESHVDRSITGPAAFMETNIIGTYTLLEATLAWWRRLPQGRQEHFRFLHVSTDEVYGSLGETDRFTETTPYDPRSPYSASKAASDHLVMAWHHTYGLPTLISNCSNNYGPFQFPEKLIPNMIIKALHGEPLPIYGDGSNVRDWLHVEDHARALQLLWERGKPGEKYNIGGNAERSNLQVVKTICTIMDELHPQGAPHDRLITFVADRPGHDWRYAIDCSKLERETGWRPSRSFETGLRDTVQWYLDRRDWWQPILDNTYRGERLGLVK